MALAEGTDLLLDHADAWAALAAVRFDAGDESRASAAQAEADRLYAAKGSTLHVSPGSQTLTSNDSRASEPDTFDADDLPAALAELEARYQVGEGAAGHPVETMANRRAREYLARWVERGPEAVRDLLSEDQRWEDHRQGLTAAEDGIDTHLAGLAVITELLQGQRPEIHEVVAVRGEHLVLTRWGITGPYEVESLSLWQFDASGRLCYSALFDLDDLAAVTDLLDERYAEGEGL